MCEQVPDDFPPLTLNTQRALTALNMERPDKLADALSALYHAFWIERQPIQKPEAAIPAFAKALGITEAEAKALWEKGNTPEAKSLLLKNTDLAFQDGAFGLPWFSATNAKGEKESFWGFDHLGQVVEHLGLERPSNNRGWKAML
jgi:2-hydroxychromene-2-carboxylate isomerase